MFLFTLHTFSQSLSLLVHQQSCRKTFGQCKQSSHQSKGNTDSYTHSVNGSHAFTLQLFNKQIPANIPKPSLKEYNTIYLPFTSANLNMTNLNMT